MIKWTSVFIVLVFISCGVTKRNSDCDNVLENVSNKIRYNDSLRIYEYTHREDLLKMENNIDAVDNKSCFKGIKFGKVKKLLGKPNYLERNQKSSNYQYYFNQGCTKTGEVCYYWEFIVDNKEGKVLMFLERNRNLPDPGIE